MSQRCNKEFSMKKIIMLLSLTFLSIGARVQDINPDLVVAAGQGNVDRVMELLNEGVSVDVANNYGKTALMVASEVGNKDIVRILLQKGANPNLTMQGQPTGCAVEETPDYPVMCAGVMPGAIPPFRAYENWTALHFASDNGSYEAAELLLKGKELPEYAYSPAYPDGYPKKPGEEVPRRFVPKKAGVPVAHANKTPLMLAAQRGDLRMVKLLLRNKADIEAKSKRNRTALYYAVAYADRTGDKGLAVIRELKNNGAQVNDEIIEVAERRKDPKSILSIIIDRPRRRGLLSIWKNLR
jgi:ankyrin repeat protein